MDDMVLQFFGVRGTLPVPGKQSICYGGNTNCITLTIDRKYFFIFDAGTGIKALSDYLQNTKTGAINAKIFITHPHYDHINGIPYFAPLYEKGNVFEFLGPNHDSLSIENLISKQMDNIYFPVTVKEFSSEIHFRTLDEGSYEVDGIKVSTIILNHPGKCLGYRVDHRGRSFCYITDNELFFENHPQYDAEKVKRLIDFIKDADVLVMDTTYTDKEYQGKVGWGHSCVSRVVDIADIAQVKVLCLHHHAPGQLDTDIEAKLYIARSLLEKRGSKTRCLAPCEGETMVV